MKQRIKTIGYVSPVVFFLGLGLYYINGLWDIYSINLTILGAAAGILYLVVCFDDLRQIFSARSFRSGTNTLLLICLVLSLIVIVNVLGYRHFYWRDITVKKKFELSILTQSILDQVKQEKKDIYITAFFWMNVEPELKQRAEYHPDPPEPGAGGKTQGFARCLQRRKPGYPVQVYRSEPGYNAVAAV